MQNKKMKVGIITVYRNINYGSNLQSYALQTVLYKIGLNAENICLDDSYKKGSLKNRLIKKSKYILKFILKKGLELNRLKQEYAFDNYVNNNINVGDYTCEEIEALESKGKHPYDYYICGSDQIWAPNQFRPIFFLSFIKRKGIKIAYAPSIGLPVIPEDLKSRYEELITDFAHLSVREKDGASLIKEITGLDVPVVLDPTLLLNRKEWLAHARIRPCKEKYILCYFLGDNIEHRRCVKRLSEQTGYKIYVLPKNAKQEQWGDKVMYNIGPSDFINMLNNAQIMCTDSFHGTIFSINLHKDFYTFLRFSSQDPLNQNSRIFNILSEVHLNERIIDNPELDISIKDPNPIDWSFVDKIIEKKREQSVNYLKESLKN